MFEFTVGDRVRYWRKLRGRSIRWLAKSSGMSKDSLSRIELGYQRARVDELERFCKALNVSGLSEFMGETTESVNNRP